MTVYADVLVALNFIVTYLMLLTASVVLKTAPSPPRLLLGSLFGGFASLLLLLPDLGLLLSVVLRGSVCALIAFLTFRTASFSRFLRCAAVLTGVGFLLFGLVFAVQSCLGAQNVFIKNGAVYMEMSFLSLVITAAVCFVLVSAVFRFLSPAPPKERIFTMRVRAGETEFSVPVLYDTGNLLCDSVFGAAAAVVSPDALQNKLPSSLLPFFSGEVTQIDAAPPAWVGRLRVLPARTVGEDGLLPGFRTDEVTIGADGKTYITRGAIVAVCKTRFREKEYMGLVGPGFFNEEIKVRKK